MCLSMAVLAAQAGQLAAPAALPTTRAKRRAEERNALKRANDAIASEGGAAAKKQRRREEELRKRGNPSPGATGTKHPAIATAAPRLPIRMIPAIDERPVCPLCGTKVLQRQLLQHKHDVHGELQVTPSPVSDRRPGLWVSVCSGGLPSLPRRK